MRIAFYAGALGIGGVNTYIQSLGEFLSRAGHSVVVVLDRPVPARWPGPTDRFDPPVITLAAARWESRRRHALRVHEHFVRAAYDAVLVNIGTYTWPLMCGIERLPETTAIVSVLHNSTPHIYDSARVNFDAWNVAVAISPRIDHDARQRLAGKPVVPITNGIALPDPEQVAGRAPWSRPLRLLYVGRLSDISKGILRLPMILAACRRRALPVHLTVIGIGEDLGRLETALAEQGVQDLVTLRGLQSNDVVYQAMRTHHVLLMPSNFEGMPLVTLEALANGLVPVVSHLPGVTDLAVEAGTCGALVEKDDIEGYADAIERLHDPQRWQADSEAGIARARRLFSLDVMGRRYLELLDGCAAGQYRLRAPRHTLPAYRFGRLDRLPHKVHQRLMWRLGRAGR